MDINKRFNTLISRNGETKQRKKILIIFQKPRTADISKTFTCKQKVALCLLATVDFMSFCQMSIMAPFYPKEAEYKGMSKTLSGFVFSFYALIMFIFSPVFGKVLPKIGVKVLFISGVLLSGITSIIFGSLNYVYDKNLFITLSFLIRGLDALGASAYSTASYVLISNIFPNNAGTVRGVMETFVGLGMSVGPAIGGFLFQIGGFGLPFYVVGSFTVILVPLSAYYLRFESTVDEDCGSVKVLLKLPGTLVTCLIIVTIAASWGFIDPTLEPGIRKFNLSSVVLGLIFLLLSAMYAISCPISGYIADRMTGYWIIMALGLFLIAFSLLLLGPCPMLTFLKDSLYLTIFAIAILGTAVGMGLMPTYQKLIDNALDGGLEDNLGTQSVVAGLWSCSHSLGEVLGPSIGGIFLEHFGFGYTCTLIALLNIVTCSITIFYFSVQRKSNASKDVYKETLENGQFRKKDWEYSIATIS